MTLVSMLAAFTLSQAEPPRPPAVQAALPVLTLPEALAQARSGSLELEVARARLGQARTLARKAWAAYLPQIAAGASATRNSDQAILDLPTGFVIRDMGQPTSRPFDTTRPPSIQNPPGSPTTTLIFPAGVETFELQKKEQLGAQVELRQAILAPAVWPAIGNAHRAERVAEQKVEEARRELLFGVAQAYYGAAGLAEVARVQEQLLETYRNHEKEAAERVAQGLAPRLALLRASTDRARAEQDLLRARNAYGSARLALATILDRPADFDVVQPPEPGAPGEPEALRSSALSRRPDVEAARAGLALARGQHDAVYYKYAPNLGLNAFYRWANITGFTGHREAWAVGLGLSWTLWDGGSREAELRETSEKVAEAIAAERLAENKAREELERALLDLSSARAGRAKAQEQVRLAREAVDQAQKSSGAGMATYVEVSDATAALLGAELSMVNETLGSQLAALRVAKAAGLFDPR